MKAKRTIKSKKPSAGKASKAAGKGNSQLEKFFHDFPRDIYWAEKHLTTALPKMQKAATTDELKNAIEEHLTQTEEHVDRLEQVFNLFNWKTQAKKCEAMQGLIDEGNSVAEETDEGTMTRDAGIILAAQKVEHYEIATYGGLVQLAITIGNEKAAGILQSTLDKEKQTDENLSEIAESGINWEAEQEPMESENKN